MLEKSRGGVCLLVTLQIASPQPYEKRIPSNVRFKRFAKILETLSDIGRTPI